MVPRKYRISRGRGYNLWARARSRDLCTGVRGVSPTGRPCYVQVYIGLQNLSKLLKGSPIMSFGACLFRIRAMIARPPIMSFDFGGRKMWEGFSTILFKSIHRDLGTVGAQGAVLRFPNFFGGP